MQEGTEGKAVAQRLGITKKGTVRIVMAALIAWASTIASAAYNANLTGIVTEVLTYDSATLLFRLDNQPVSHPTCNPQYFSIPGDVVAVTDLNRMYSRLMVAKVTGESLNIGYDNQSSCAAGYMRAYRVG